MNTAKSDNRIKVVPCADTALLTALFLELMADENTDAPVCQAQAASMMESFLAHGDKAYTFQIQGDVVGYALVICDRSPKYLRHFFICRQSRRHGYGTDSFHALLKTLDAHSIDLDVFVWNERGKAFWSSLGFAPRTLMMRYHGQKLKI